jgi:hypothetical protein
MEKCLGLSASKNCAKLGLLDGIEKKKRDFIEISKYLIQNRLSLVLQKEKKTSTILEIDFCHFLGTVTSK